MKKRLDYLFLLPLMGKLPLRAAYKMARWRGLLRYCRGRDVRERMTSNLSAVLGMDRNEARAIARKVYENQSVEELEVYLMPKVNHRYMERYHHFEGLDNLEAALSAGCGAILANLHFGSFCMSLVMLGTLGYRLNAIAGPYGTGYTDPVDTVHIDRKVKRMKKVWNGGEFFFVGNLTRREVVGTLQGRSILIVALDAQLGEGKKAVVNFLGKEGSFPLSAFRLASMAGAPIVPYVTIREGDGVRLKTKFMPPLYVTKGENPLLYRDHLQKAMDILCGYIRRYPDHWFYLQTPANWANLEEMWK